MQAIILVNNPTKTVAQCLLTDILKYLLPAANTCSVVYGTICAGPMQYNFTKC